MKIAMGCAKVAYDLKEAVKAHLLGRGFEVVDFCEDPADPMPYAEVAARAAQGMLDAGCERGILFCGTGMGVSLVANLFPGITAAVVESKFAARRCRYTNNANVLCMGGRVISSGLACELVDVFLDTAYEGGRHQRRVDMLTELDKKKQ